MEKQIGFLYLQENEKRRIQEALEELELLSTDAFVSFDLDSLLKPNVIDNTLLFVSVHAKPALAAGQIPTFVSELLALRALHRSFSWIALCSPELEPLFPLFYAMGASACLPQPCNAFRLVHLAESFLQGTSDAVREFGVIELLMMGHFLGVDVTYTLSLEEETKSGSISLKEGEFCHASCGDLVEKEALHELLSWSNPTVSVGLSSFQQSSIFGDFWLVLRDFCATIAKPVWEQIVSKEAPISSNLPTQTKESKNMADLNSLCREVVDDVTDALACGVVDLNSGMLLAAHHNVHYFTQAYMDAVAAAAVDIFRGKNVRRVEQLLSKHRGKPLKDALLEVFMKTANTFHFMQVLPTKGVVVVLVTRTTTNQGMGWAGLRNACTDVEDAL